LEVEFTFVKQAAVIKGPSTPHSLKRSNSSISDGSNKSSTSLTQSPIEFSAVPSNIKIPPNSAAVLNIVAKLKNSYQLAIMNNKAETGSDGVIAPIEKYNHLLIAKIKDTSLMFSFIIEASVLESNGKDAGMS